MANVALLFDIIGRDFASPTLKKVGVEAEATSARVGKIGKALGAFVAVDLIGHAVKAAGDYQFQMNRLVHAAGETQANISGVSKAILGIMADTGTSMHDATAGAYMVESAGYHGAAGMEVLRNAAKGAKIENADLGEVTNAVSSAMVDYHYKASQSAEVVNILISAVAHGKTTMGEMATAFVNVGAAGASAHVPMEDLAAAIATMTQHGTAASVAGTYLRQVIGQLEAPSAIARKTMAGLGLDANKLGLTLSSGSGGLAKAIGMVDDAITSHLKPSGLVAIATFKKSAGTTSDYQKMLANLPPSMTTTFGALADMTGGVKSLQGFLQLGGENLKTYKENTKAVGEAARGTKGEVDGWAETQKTFAVQWAKFKAGLEVVKIQIGTGLLPAVTSLVGELGSMVTFVRSNWAVIGPLAGVIAGLTLSIWAVNLATKAWAATTRAWAAICAVARFATGLWTASVWALGLAMDANPIGLIIIGIIALIAVIVLIATKTRFFQTVWKYTWSAIKTAFHATVGAIVTAWQHTWSVVQSTFARVISFIKSHWVAIVGIIAGPIGLAVAMIIKHWNTIKSATTSVMNAIKGAFSKTWAAFKSGIATAISTVRAMPGKVLGAIGSLGSMLVQKGKDFIQGFISGIESKAASIPGIIKNKVVGAAESALHGFGLFGSPSKLTMKYGKWWSEGFSIGMKDSADDIISKTQDMIGKLKDKLDAIKGFNSAIRDSFKATADVSSFAPDATTGEGSVLETLRLQLANDTAYRTGFQSLQKMGLNATTLGQLRDAGPGSLAAVQSLLGGGQAGVNQANSYTKQILAQGGGLADAETMRTYGTLGTGKQAVTLKLGKQDVHLKLDFGAAGADDAFIAMMRKAIRAKGGNVQVVLGKGA